MNPILLILSMIISLIISIIYTLIIYGIILQIYIFKNKKYPTTITDFLKIHTIAVSIIICTIIIICILKNLK
jgi:hypothetical protein